MQSTHQAPGLPQHPPNPPRLVAAACWVIDADCLAGKLWTCARVHTPAEYSSQNVGNLCSLPLG